MSPRNYLILALLGTIAILCMRDCSQQEKIRNGQNAQELLARQGDTIKYLISENQKVIGQVKTQVATEENLKILLAENRELKKRVGKLARINVYNSVGFSATDTLFDTAFVTIPTGVDTAIVRLWTFQDPYLSFQMSDTNGVGTAVYSYTDNLELLIYEKVAYRWWWKNGAWWRIWNIRASDIVTDVKFDNPKAKATRIKSIFRKD